MKDFFKKNTVRTAFLMVILTIGSKLIGFVREMVMAGFYGTSYITDAYVMATSIPGILFAGVFGAIAIAYMPLYSERLESKGEKEANIFTSQIINILLVVSTISAMVGIFFSSEIVDIFSRGFTGETAELTTNFVRITFIYTLFSSMSNILEAYSQYKGTFLPQVLIGYTQSISIIAAIIISIYTTVYFLVYGLLIAYIVRAILMWLLAKNQGFKYIYSTKNIAITTKQMLTLAVPVFIGSGITQINQFIDKTLASGLKEGCVSALNYANLLNGLVITLTITILSTIIYPKLTQANTANDTERFMNLVSKGLNLIIVVVLPFSFGAIIYSTQIVEIVYERGAFDQSATMLTASAYLYYSIGLIFTALNEFLVRIYYSIHETKAPMIFAGITVIINIILNLVLINYLEHAGLALATSIAACFNTIILIIGMKKMRKDIKLNLSFNKFIRIFTSAIIAVFMSKAFYDIIVNHLGGVIASGFFSLSFAIIIAMSVYIILLRIFKIDELKLLKNVIK